MGARPARQLRQSLSRRPAQIVELAPRRCFKFLNGKMATSLRLIADVVWGFVSSCGCDVDCASGRHGRDGSCSPYYAPAQGAPIGSGWRCWPRQHMLSSITEQNHRRRRCLAQDYFQLVGNSSIFGTITRLVRQVRSVSFKARRRLRDALPRRQRRVMQTAWRTSMLVLPRNGQVPVSIS